MSGGIEPRTILITGGAGFIGTNLAHRLLTAGQRVLILDNLSRAGVEHNLRWLRERHGDQVQAQIADVCNPSVVRDAVQQAERVFHLAAQVAVTTSLTDPVHDFEVNARGTLNVLEAIRAQDRPIPLLYTSTSKVYGNLHDVELVRSGTRYEPCDPELRRRGVSESRSLAFHGPHGCSKGSADQYVLDYARVYDIPAVVFRLSCIYGPHQFGTEDQGWVAHFLTRALRAEPITIHGDGAQVRDVLFVEDLVDAFLLAHDHMSILRGRVFNIGGGPRNTSSLLELIDRIARLSGSRPELRFSVSRRGDQRYYVSDIRAFNLATGWSPQIGVAAGVKRLYHWLTTESPLTVSQPVWEQELHGRNGIIFPDHVGLGIVAAGAGG